jgi:hypothetical protein
MQDVEFLVPNSWNMEWEKEEGAEEPFAAKQASADNRSLFSA